MRGLLPALVVAALVATACSPEPQDQDLTAVDARGEKAGEGEPIAAPLPDLRPLEVESDPFPASPGVHDLAVTTVEQDGRRTERGVRVHVPAGEGPFPVVVALHPFGGNGRGFDNGTGLGSRGAERGAVVVLPDAVDGAWNAAITCCQPAVGQERPDVEFVLALLDLVAEALPVDAERVGATGFSNGGYLSYRLACDTGAFTAIAPVAGTMDRPCPAPSPVSVLHIHGLEDQVIPMVDARAPFTPGAESRGARHVVDFWARRAGCDARPADDLTASVTFVACDAGVDVQLVGVPGLTHRWSSSPDATDLVLDFLTGPPR